MFNQIKDPRVLTLTLMASAVLLVTMGARQSLGLFVGPINTSTGLGIVSISFALAVGQFVWGAIQPIAGAMADRWGPRPVLLAGLWLLALGTAITPLMDSASALTMSMGVLMAAGSGTCSFSVLMGAAAQQMSAQSRGMASGVINAGGSLGQFVFAPVLQRLIQTLGWMGAMWAMAASALMALPLVNKMTQGTHATSVVSSDGSSVGTAVQQALSDRSYILLHLGFFTCGFHIAFLVTHLPTEVGLCGLSPAVASWSLALIGLANVAGSLYAGSCVNRYRSKLVLSVMYGSRAILIGLYLLAPKTDLTFYLFAIGLGFTWLATVPPTAAIIGKLFGVRYLATLFGLTLLSHQIGGFLGAYVGGLVLQAQGDYHWMWWADMALSAMAALVNLPIREAPIHQVAAI
jgi:predicted MFS family arabinose efflux permease